MGEPYWGGTLDASCEDKEAAWAALEGFLAAYSMTHQQKYLDWAQHAADVVLTYLVVWDIQLPPGRLRNHDFKTRGWTAVSVQNQHIDVYGVLIAPSLYQLGELTGRPELKDVAEMMFRSCGQLIDPFGSQGEQPQHTNYAQRVQVSLRSTPVLEEGRPSGQGGRVELLIRDDGRGFDVHDTPSDRLGLGIMRERAQAIGAALAIDSEPGEGTEVRVVWTAPG